MNIGIIYFPFNVSQLLLVFCEQNFRCSQVQQFSGAFSVGGGGLGTGWGFLPFVCLVWFGFGICLVLGFGVGFFFSYFSYISRSCIELTLNICGNKQNGVIKLI